MALKEKALRRLADKFSAKGVTWAIGGSWLLCQHGILDTFHDFDILVAEKDADKAENVLARLGMAGELPHTGNAYQSAYHFDGADIETFAGMVIDGRWHVQFDAAAIAGQADVQGAPVNLMHLEDWFVLYSLMGKQARAEAIAAYLKDKGAAHPERFAQVVAEPLPEDLLEKIKAITEA